MKAKNYFLYLLILVAALSAGPVLCAASAAGAGSGLIDETTHVTDGGFGLDAIRNDNQQTFRVPAAEADAVYQYLLDNYVNSNDFMGKNFSSWGLAAAAENDGFTDDYFDTPQMDLLKTQSSVRHRSRVNLDNNPNDKKNGRELVQIKISPEGRFANNRMELKFKVKNGKKNKKIADNHPLIGLISDANQPDGSTQRKQFKEAVGKLGLDPFSLKHIVTLNQHRRRVYLNQGKDNIITFSVDEINARILWAKTRFVEMDFGLSEVTYTAADGKKRQAMNDLRDIVRRDLLARFPDIQAATEPKYQRAFLELTKQISFLPWLIRWNIFL